MVKKYFYPIFYKIQRREGSKKNYIVQYFKIKS